MATTFRLRLIAQSETLARQLAVAAWSELARLENLLSRFVDGSDISRINYAKVGDAVRINADTLQCLIEATRMAGLTHGAFNPLLGAWTAQGPQARPATPGRREAPTAHLLLDSTSLTAARVNEDSLLDLGGIGKGFAVDKLVGLLREWDISAACIDAGGSTVFAYGRPDAGSAWQAQMMTQWIPLENASVASSGTAVKGNHIIDDRDGGSRLRQSRVWSYAPTAAEADALSTAFFVFSNQETETFCAENPPYGAAWLTPENTICIRGALAAATST